LVHEEYPEENRSFLESAGIQFFQFPIPGNKEPFVVIPDSSITGALITILDKRNHPILVHCNAGRVYTLPFLMLTNICSIEQVASWVFYGDYKVGP
jgi:protein tyrosine phosphatase